MTWVLGPGELIPNALIELIERTGIRQVKLENIRRYGEKVKDILTRGGAEVYINWTDEKYHNFMNFNGNVFSSDNFADGEVISVNDTIDSERLRMRFRPLISIDVLKALISQSAVECLLNDDASTNENIF